MTIFKTYRLLFIAVVISLTLLSGCGAITTATPSPTPSPTATLPSVTPEPATEGEPNASGGGASSFSAIESAVDSIPTRTPIPPATPDVLLQGVMQLAPVDESQLSQETFLWLSLTDWLNILISLLIVVVGYLLGTWLIRRVLPRLVRRTKTPIDDELLQLSGKQLRWIVVALVLNFATSRLNFVHPQVKTWLIDIYFFWFLFLSVNILWRLTNLIALWTGERMKRQGTWESNKSLITLAMWAMRLVILILAVTLIFGHFAIPITSIAITVGLIALTLSLAGRELFADIIAGIMILIDRPFRHGDRIELLSLKTTGNIYEIGLRYTKVLAMDNRMVIVPNSVISRDQIINYSYPDPSYNDATDILVAYENDVAQLLQLIQETVRSVEGVDTESAVDVQLAELTASHMRFRALWWIKSYTDIMRIRERVHRAVIQALKDAGVVLPYQKNSVTVHRMTEPMDELEKQQLA